MNELFILQVSTKELLLMVVFLMSGVMVFASIIHYAEPTNFTSIPIGIWWALVTMTTVGYGDRVPNTAVGYLFGCMSVIGGVLVIAFTGKLTNFFILPVNCISSIFYVNRFCPPIKDSILLNEQRR